MPRLMHILLALALRGLLSLQHLLHPLFNPALHHAEILLRIYMLDHLRLSLRSNERHLLGFRVLGLLALDAGVEAVSRTGRLVGHGKHK